jgi:hypothetical protein
MRPKGGVGVTWRHRNQAEEVTGAAGSDIAIRWPSGIMRRERRGEWRGEGGLNSRGAEAKEAGINDELKRGGEEIARRAIPA